ncbi:MULTISPECIES: YeeE/YedE family protein [Clostridia]|uniref:YeeE/YedE family protein n=1 Tax=Clostridia TaxID=186801 RepID=UPI000E9FFA74|nr:MULTISPECIES: YeeE/YedE family protein [Clostridia]NBJ71096.1 YeeE/YedE family protein [Roseburia sp. 1XD42-34]RKI75279.1 YeeE/YedE family protein [Clostridium sp. 1xD42-85]
MKTNQTTIPQPKFKTYTLLIQSIVGLIVIALVGYFGSFLAHSSQKLTLYLLTGVALGYILTRSTFGFAGGVKKIYVTGFGGLSKALIIMFAITMIGMIGIHWYAAANGAVPAFMAEAGDAIIPGSKSVNTLSIATIVGGFIFGIGMIMAGACASGTLTDIGEGATRAMIVLPFFVLGTAPGELVRYKIHDSALGEFSTTMYLPHTFGFIGALLVSLFALLLLYILVNKYEAFRKKEGFYEEELLAYDEKAIEAKKDYKFFSYETYHKFFIERWSFLTGAILLAVMFIFIVNTTGSSWGVTSAFSRWDVAFLQNFGFEFNSPAFTSILEDVNNGLLNHNGTVRNIGIIFGSLIALLLAGKFKFNFNYSMKDAFIYAGGGLIMGFGARCAGGCNIGALFSAICNFSLAGWGFTVALILGGIVGLKLFEGRLNIIPPNRHRR